jgi:carbon storage regulator CsrA
MLRISRKPGEAVYIGKDVKITVIAVHGQQVRLSIEAPRRTVVLRNELCARCERCKEELAPGQETRVVEGAGEVCVKCSGP